eukprot:scaffold43977_cov55-Phaeocystis_antarctica.AAC.2
MVDRRANDQLHHDTRVVRVAATSHTRRQYRKTLCRPRARTDTRQPSKPSRSCLLASRRADLQRLLQ